MDLHAAITKIYWLLLRLARVDKILWNRQYSRGRWQEDQRSPAVIELTTRLCRGGKLVEFGCGSGLLPLLLPVGTFSNYLGVDVSDVAIRLANKRETVNCQFRQQRMQDWKGDENVSLILAEECLYYLGPEEQRRFLKLCRDSLVPEGTILVIVHDQNKHKATLEVCRRTCHVRFEQARGKRAYLVLSKT